MPFDGFSGHMFKRFKVTNEAPTPAPSAPTLSPTLLTPECSASTCAELG